MVSNMSRAMDRARASISFRRPKRNMSCRAASSHRIRFLYHRAQALNKARAQEKRPADRDIDGDRRAAVGLPALGVSGMNIRG